MIIEVTQKNEVKFYPIFMGNDKAAAKDKFCFVMTKPHNLMVQTASLTAGGRFDLASFIKAHVLRIDNPPLINIDSGKAREMTIDDVCLFTELESLFTELSFEVTSMQKAKEVDIKN